MPDFSARSRLTHFGKSANVGGRTLLDRAVLASVLATTVMSLTALATELHAVPPLAASSVKLVTLA